MKGSDLLSIWEAPDNSRLTPKQVSLRLPVHIAARIAALCDMYPNKTKTEIMGDLLGMALDQLQASFPQIKGDVVEQISGPQGVTVLYEDLGPTNRFYALSNKYYGELEKELGNGSPTPLFPHDSYIEEEGR